MGNKNDKSDREDKDGNKDGNKIECISVIVRLVSIRGGSLNWT